MIERDDIRAAVASGLLSEQQAANLISLSDSRRGARENLAVGDEPFELFKGFNEIFIVIGLLILSIGWSSIVGVVIADQMASLQRTTVIIGIIGGVLIWLLSEYFVRKRRMVAPAIALSVMFAINIASTFIVGMSEPFMVAQNDYSSVPLPLFLATLTLLVYWWRFRVPFAMAMIAVGLFAVAIVFAASRGGEINDISEFFLLSADGPFAWITLFLGVAVFAVAMVFDMSDPHRVTRRSANGFWLHVDQDLEASGLRARRDVHVDEHVPGRDQAVGGGVDGHRAGARHEGDGQGGHDPRQAPARRYLRAVQRRAGRSGLRRGDPRGLHRGPEPVPVTAQSAPLPANESGACGNNPLHGRRKLESYP